MDLSAGASCVIGVSLMDVGDGESVVVDVVGVNVSEVGMDGHALRVEIGRSDERGVDCRSGRSSLELVRWMTLIVESGTGSREGSIVGIRRMSVSGSSVEVLVLASVHARAVVEIAT